MLAVFYPCDNAHQPPLAGDSPADKNSLAKLATFLLSLLSWNALQEAAAAFWQYHDDRVWEISVYYRHLAMSVCRDFAYESVRQSISAEQPVLNGAAIAVLVYLRMGVAQNAVPVRKDVRRMDFCRCWLK